jgi:hypothetical protein
MRSPPRWPRRAAPDRSPHLALHPEASVNEKQLAKLIKQNQQKIKTFDPTLVTKQEDDDANIEREQLFKELKRREF